MSMSEQELAEIRARVEAERGKTFLAAATVEGSTRLGAGNQARADREALLAEVERLRTQLEHDNATTDAVLERIQDEEARSYAMYEKLRAENAALKLVAEFGCEVARELASPRRRIAGTEVVHLPDELMATARTLLVSQEPPEV